MKYAVMSQIIVDLPAKRDTLVNDILTRMGGKPVWGETIISKGLNRAGKPQCSIEARFASRADRDDIATFIKNKIVQLPALSGSVKVHTCSHDEANPQPCIEQEI